MKQLIPFDTAKGGKQPGYCLSNVRLGYGIPGKYPNAISAWNATQQHKDRNFPALDVPLYFSYKTDGHIGVRLKDGRFWSDGNFYSSLDAYELTHSPIFLGWGESVNDVKVIEKDNDMYPNSGDLTNFYNSTGYPGHKPNANDIAYWANGTGNANWSKGADQVWKDLMYEVTNYVLKHPQSPSYKEVGTIDGKKVYRKG